MVYGGVWPIGAVIVDQDLKPWLLEVNTSPALMCECETDEQVKAPLMRDLVELLRFEEPPAADHKPSNPVD